jgi:hypothetical protein
VTGGGIGNRGAWRRWHSARRVGTEMDGVRVSDSAAPGDVALALGSLGGMSPGLLKPYLPGSPSSMPTPINWRRVENVAEPACLQVATAERLLHEALYSSPILG